MPFLNEANAAALAAGIVAKSAADVVKKIVSVIDGSSTNEQIPGAKAVYDLVTASVTSGSGLSFQVVETAPETGDSNVIYLVKADDDTFTQYIFSDGKRYDLGTLAPDLTGYWSKAELRAMTDEEVQAIVNGLGA
jgi:hypothetical protein